MSFWLINLRCFETVAVWLGLGTKSFKEKIVVLEWNYYVTLWAWGEWNMLHKLTQKFKLVKVVARVWDMNSRLLDEGAVFSDLSMGTSSPNT